MGGQLLLHSPPRLRVDRLWPLQRAPGRSATLKGHSGVSYFTDESHQLATIAPARRLLLRVPVPCYIYAYTRVLLMLHC
jgi:hypothetical protein